MAGLAAFVVYLVSSAIIFGGSTLAHLGTEYIPRQDASDSEFFRWALAWAPWAVAHGRNPLVTDVLHAPQGASLVWTTAVPGPALAMWPVTAVFGPLVSYNVLTLLAPALAAWAAYLLCRRVSHRFWPSLVAGAVFGFSAYMTIQLNHPNLALSFPIPLLVYFVVRRVEGSLGSKAFVVLSAVTLLALWSISIELFATTTMFGALAYVIALVAAGPDRARLTALLPAIGISYAIVIAVVLFPYLLPALREAPASLAINPEKKYNDLLRFIFPRDRQLIGGGSLMAWSARFADPVASGVAFVGIGMIAMVIGYAFTERRRRETWPIVAFLVIAAVLALGPQLYVHAHRTIPLPEGLVSLLPLIKNALPGRFMIFVNLALSVIAALWLAQVPRTRGVDPVGSGRDRPPPADPERPISPVARARHDPRVLHRRHVEHRDLAGRDGSCDGREEGTGHGLASRHEDGVRAPRRVPRARSPTSIRVASPTVSSRAATGSRRRPRSVLGSPSTA